ncbi:hypothetical protein ACIQ9P_08180 [Kitasatospora sp. NPDC094019]|uniref:hypothetical protein n=1 Tax=Kitasatospora sp. NPDC094019 TaxID=3364091 RepID=UPI0038225E0C
MRLADHLLTAHGDTPRQVVDELAARAERLFARLPDEVLAAIPAPSRTCPGNYFFPVDVPAETLRRQYGLLAVPAGVFGDGGWSGSVLTSLAAAFGPTPVAPPVAPPPAPASARPVQGASSRPAVDGSLTITDDRRRGH